MVVEVYRGSHASKHIMRASMCRPVILLNGEQQDGRRRSFRISAISRVRSAESQFCGTDGGERERYFFGLSGSANTMYAPGAAAGSVVIRG